MGLIIKNGVRYFGDNSVELTQAQYDDLSEAEKLNGTTYFITDGQSATSLEDLSDVDVTSVADGDLLTFDDVSGKWVNLSASTRPLFYMRTFSGTKSLPANSVGVVTRADLGMTDDVPDGYQRLGITRAQSNANSGMIGSFYASASTNILRVYNPSSAAINPTFTIDVIYVRSEFFATYTPPSS